MGWPRCAPASRAKPLGSARAAGHFRGAHRTRSADATPRTPSLLTVRCPAVINTTPTKGGAQGAGHFAPGLNPPPPSPCLWTDIADNFLLQTLPREYTRSRPPGTLTPPSWHPGPPPPRPPRIQSSRGSVDTTKTRSDPQRVRTCKGERPIGAAKGTPAIPMASCRTPFARKARSVTPRGVGVWH